jgi:hypothetical protein
VLPPPLMCSLGTATWTLTLPWPFEVPFMLYMRAIIDGGDEDSNSGVVLETKEGGAAKSSSPDLIWSHVR